MSLIALALFVYFAVLPVLKGAILVSIAVLALIAICKKIGEMIYGEKK